MWMQPHHEFQLLRGKALFCSQGLHLLTLEIRLLSFVPPLLVENIFLQLYMCRHHKFWGGPGVY